jgi:hypothetical protein
VRKVIPEKLVELWTAHTILAEFGLSTRIWAPTRSFDQTARPVRGKRFVLELKAPKWETSEDQPSGFPAAQLLPLAARPVEIDVGQLLEYVDTIDMEVIYVLPQPSHYRPVGVNRYVELEAQRARDTFGDWSYVICSSRLLHLIGSDPRVATLKNRRLANPPEVSSKDRAYGGRYVRRKTAMVVCDMNGSTPRAHLLSRGVRGPGVDVMSLRCFLAMLQLCPFDRPLVERSTSLGIAVAGAMPEGLRPVEPPDADNAFWAGDRPRLEQPGPLAGSLLVVEVDVSPPAARR